MANDKFNSYFLIHYFIIITVFAGVASGEYCYLYDFNRTLLDPSWQRSISNIWNIDNSDYKVGPFSLSTGLLSCAGFYNISRNVTGPGYMTFWWKKTPYPRGFTRMYLLIDEELASSYQDSNSEWKYVIRDFGDGPHMLKWVFQIERSSGGTVCWPMSMAA